MTDNFVELPLTCATSLASIYKQNGAQVNNVKQAHTESSEVSRAPVSVTVNSVNVPRPTPLVQTNVGIAFPSSQDSLQNGQQVQLPAQRFPEPFQRNQSISVIQTDKPQSLHKSHDQSSSVNQSQASEKSHDSGQSQDREFLASQIAELNKQHAEAQKRLQNLMGQQQHATQVAPEIQQQQQYLQQQQQQQQRQQVVENQQRLQQQQLQYEQQQKLIEMVMQQQQKIQKQQQLQKQLQQQQQKRTDIPKDGEHGNVLRQSADIPGYVPQRQVGIPF